MKQKRTFAVLGLGIFGSTLAKELSRFHQDVIAIDKEMSCVERISEFVSNAICLDFMDKEQLEAAGVGDADVAIVATGSHLEEALMAVLNLKDLGVPKIMAKAKNKKYAQILTKIGADWVILPEKQTGLRTAKALLSSTFIDVLDIDNEHSIIDINVPVKWIGKNLQQLELRQRIGMNVIAIRKGGQDGQLEVTPDPNIPLNKDDELLVLVNRELFDKIDEFNESEGEED